MNKRYSVLIVDDQENWRTLLGDLLEDEFDVNYATSYESAVESVLEKSPPYHLVVTDIRLIDSEKGNEDGIRLLATTLKKHQSYTKTIVITGYPSIDTAKKALGGYGDAYDYLEKVPANGNNFDEKEFVRIAQRAADDADQGRPDSFTQLDWNVLIIEPDPQWRKKLGDYLRKDNYHVDELETTDSLVNTLQAKTEPYGLVLVRDYLINGSEDFYPNLQRLHPEARVVVLTDQNIGDMIRKIREGLVYSVITLQEKGPFKNTFRQLVKDVYTPERRKYVTVSLIGALEKSGCVKGERYSLELAITDKWISDSTAINFFPQPGKHGKTQIKVFTYAPGCKLLSEAERFWEFTQSNRDKRLIIEFIPQKIGDVKISIDLDLDNRWLGRVEKLIEITG